MALRKDRDAKGKLAGIVGLEDEHKQAREMRACLRSISQPAHHASSPLLFALAMREIIACQVETG
jgi:hypothetical protein